MTVKVFSILNNNNINYTYLNTKPFGGFLKEYQLFFTNREFRYKVGG